MHGLPQIMITARWRHDLTIQYNILKQHIMEVYCFLGIFLSVCLSYFMKYQQHYNDLFYSIFLCGKIDFLIRYSAAEYDCNTSSNHRISQRQATLDPQLNLNGKGVTSTLKLIHTSVQKVHLNSSLIMHSRSVKHTLQAMVVLTSWIRLNAAIMT